ncbi:MAG TPA: hypothetical protein VFN11_04915 [Ktedonobacterales bacterium]|nr:hypothetical protein [Ktedonobacterales bacterium]
MPRRRRVPLWLVLALPLVVAVTVVGTAAFQPRVANHFGYALAGRDGLPSYIYANGRRYQSFQVCAGADWCQQDRLQQLIPRCYTQANLQTMHLWPLRQVSWMFTLIGAPQPIMSPVGESGVTRAFVMADGPDCYVTYTLEGGP